MSGVGGGDWEIRYCKHLQVLFLRGELLISIGQKGGENVLSP